MNIYVLKIIDKNMYYVILDEIQKVEDFESVLNGFLHIENVDIYVTGSNSKFLSSDIRTEFRGRGDEIRSITTSIFGILLQVMKETVKKHGTNTKLMVDYQESYHKKQMNKKVNI